MPYRIKEEHIEDVIERKTLKDNLELYINLSRSDMIKLLKSLVIGFLGYIVFYILLAATHVRASYIENSLLWYVIVYGCFMAIDYIVPLMWDIYVLTKLKKILKKEYTEEIITVDGDKTVRVVNGDTSIYYTTPSLDVILKIKKKRK